MEFWLKNTNSDKFRLPVNPSSYEISVAHKNTTVDVVELGEVNLLGKTGLREVSLASFFPKQSYSFSNSDRMDPEKYISMIDGWRTSNTPIRIIITDVLNMECTIEDFTYGEQDGTRDLYFELSLKEYKKIVTKKATVTVATYSKVKGSKRTVEKQAGGTYTVKSGDCLSKIAKQFYGSGSSANYMKIANANGIKNPNLIYPNQVLTIPA